MGLKQTLNEDLKQAMKGGDTTKRAVLRMLLASTKNAEIAKRGELEDADIVGLIAKDIRQHQESIESFKQGNRPDLVEKETAEMAVLEAYMPQQLTRDEVARAARQVIGEVGAQGPSDKGKVMKELMPKLKGQADGRVINEVVTELLGQ